jgi:hypothetical protein
MKSASFGRYGCFWDERVQKFDSNLQSGGSYVGSKRIKIEFDRKRGRVSQYRSNFGDANTRTDSFVGTAPCNASVLCTSCNEFANAQQGDIDHCVYIGGINGQLSDLRCAF